MRAFLIFLACLVPAPALATCPPKIEADFRAALAARDEARIYAATAAARACLGDPKPEEPERYEYPFRLPKQPDGDETGDRIDQYWAGISPLLWWQLRDPPTGDKALTPLRVPASLLRGAAMGLSARPEQEDLYRERAELAASYLMLAQIQGGIGVYPTPAWEGDSSDRVRTLTDRFVKRARRDGVLETVVRNGWIVDDRNGAGDLQFDNGLSGEAMLAWHAVSPNPDVLASAKRAGDWAMSQPLSANFNYNGFSAAFLAKLGQATGEQRYIDESTARARLGVLPGMIMDGPFAGHWIDPHNERLVYRLIMIRQLAAVATVLPVGSPDRVFISKRLQMALDAAEDQQRAVKKIAHPETAIKAYCELAGLAGVASKRPDVMAIVRDIVIASGKAITPRVDPHAFHCALSIPPPYPNLNYPWETTLWPK